MSKRSSQMVLDPLDERWKAFISKQPKSNIFHHPAWITSISECYGYRPFVITVFDKSGRIRAGLPFMEINSRIFGRRWVSLPFTDHCVPLNIDSEGLFQLYDQLQTLLEEQDTPPMEFHWEIPIRPPLQLYRHYVIHTMKLSPGFDAVSKRFHHSHQRNVRVALKRGVHIERGKGIEAIKQFYQLHLQTRRRQGIPIQPWYFFESIQKNLIERGLGFVLLAYHQDECLAGAVFLNWQKTLTYKFGASSIKGLSMRPNNLLVSTAIRWGCENGYTKFDLGRTDLDNIGLREYKRRWGAQEFPLNYTKFPYKNESPVTSKIMPLMNFVIRNAPEFICRISGELLYKYFP